MNLGFAHGAIKRDDDALRMFRRSRAEPAALNNLALAHELLGNREEARRLYLEATERDPRLKGDPSGGASVSSLGLITPMTTGLGDEAGGGDEYNYPGQRPIQLQAR